MICPSCNKSQPMTFRCRSCGAQLMGGRYRDADGAPAASAAPELRPPVVTSGTSHAGLHNPYAAPQAATGAAFTGPRESHVLASRGARLAASLVDGLAALAAAIPLVFGIALADSSSGSGATTGLAIVGILAFGAFAIYQIRLLIGEGQTIGKKLMNIRIVDYHDGTVPSVSQVFLRRYVLNGVLGNIPFYSFVDILMIFGAEKRCIHDYLAGTKVVDA